MNEGIAETRDVVYLVELPEDGTRVGLTGLKQG